jgi:hypothetical protein
VIALINDVGHSCHWLSEQWVESWNAYEGSKNGYHNTNFLFASYFLSLRQEERYYLKSYICTCTFTLPSFRIWLPGLVKFFPARSSLKRTTLENFFCWLFLADIWSLFFYVHVLYSTLFHLPTLPFHCVGGCWDWTQCPLAFIRGGETLRKWNTFLICQTIEKLEKITGRTKNTDP